MFFKSMTDLEISTLSLAQCLYVREMNSFNDMSEVGREYWIDKYGEQISKLVDEELQKGKENKKWIKEAIKSAGALHKYMIKV